MESKKKQNQRFKFIFYTLLISFLFVYMSGKSGYYETNIQKHTLLTSDAIKEFEKDVEAGKPVDIKDYIKSDVSDYRNTYSKLGYNVSKTVDTILNEGVSKVSQFLKALFT